jgi:CDP-diacylglycerol--glycerol-3-phosphate 3-phosphatidyltransferase
MVPDNIVDRWIALAIFLLASATDGLDGYIARSRGQVTNLGKLLDPVADKLLVTAALLPLVRKDLVPDFMAALLIGREFLISGLRSVASAEGVVIPAGKVGKWKMGMSITAISFLIVTPRNPANTWPPWVPDGTYFLLGTTFLWVTLALSVGSAALYFWEYRHFIRPDKEPPVSS